MPIEIKHRFTGAVIRTVDADTLAGADLTGADLTGAKLMDAKLMDAKLTDAKLMDADITDAKLTGAVGIIGLGTPDCYTAFGWVKDGWLMIRVGCKQGRPDEVRAHNAGRDDRREVLAAVDYCIAIAKARGWPVEAPQQQAAE